MIRIINDIHLGASRKAGTTPASQAALKAFVRTQFSDLVDSADGHLVINGDLFDGFTVESSDVITAFTTLSGWLSKGDRKLTLIAGNHDHSPKADRTSSFQLLSHILASTFSNQVKVIDHTTGLEAVAPNVWAIPHMPNQDLFNVELEKAKAVSLHNTKYLLLHANYDNHFAESADHSLNVSQDQAKELFNAGWHLVFAHEHQRREAPGVTVVGNQIPTSIADCLGNDNKCYAVIDEDGIHLREWMSLAGLFVRRDWNDSADIPDGALFIRVEGEASADTADEVVSRISAIRQASQAFVVTNSVKFDGVAEFDMLAEMTFDQVVSFDVLSALLEELSDEEAAVVRSLLTEEN